ncbi:hypothetical protein [Steroidobacter cummioxidans]|uniref:hypothetical protein n=1 Tax=Steroidobacter cummioxidans TaxID=1803913 RepID=UPI00128FE45D|nr:hypothetical protein [Steroidobacter cummioxidans]
MTARHAHSRALVYSSSLLLLTLVGCSDSKQAATPVQNTPRDTPTDNTSVVTRSTSDRIKTVSGGTRTLSFTFTSSDAHALTNLRITTDLTRLPAGWSGPASFSCANVTTGSGCVLNLTYAPLAGGSGTLNLDYSYTNALGNTKTGRELVDYSATANNNVVATAAPTGQVISVASEGSQPVNVTFTTDDGFPASALQITTALASLPSGWSTSSTTFECELVSTGNGCQLSLTYAPTTGGGGALTLDYTYQDNSGTSKHGSANIAYAATTRNNVNGTVAPSGQIAAVVGGGGQPVNVTFMTDDGFSASALQITTALASLPTGWSVSSATLDCATVSVGNGCQLSLTYTPATTGSGTLTLGYTYQDNAGTSKNGSINIAYTATANNNVVGNVAPGGQITAVAGVGNRPVHITFTTDDDNTVSQFAVTTDLSTLPMGWSSTVGALTCATVSVDLPCELPLLFAPAVFGSGNLTLNYSYRDNSGTAKTGSLTIPYAATVNNNIAATVSQSSIAVHTGQMQTVTLTYATDDGNPATNFTVTNLPALPEGWFGPSDFTCANVTGNNSCQLSLFYLPRAPAAATLTLGFSYLDNSGTSKFGTASINYSAADPVLYISYSDASFISECDLDGYGMLRRCLVFDAYGSGRIDLGYRSGKLYYANSNLDTLGAVWRYGGGLAGTSIGYQVTNPLTIGVHPAVNALFVNDVGQGLKRCPLNIDGDILSCSLLNTQRLTKVVFSANGTRAYGAYYQSFPGGWRLQSCSATSSSLSSCLDTGINTSRATMVSQVIGDRLYSLRDGGGLLVCAINSSGTLGMCVDTAVGESVTRAAFTTTNAYLTTNDTYLKRCPILSDGTLDTCIPMGSFHFASTFAITVK